jgi:hypothetical protein
MTVLRTLPLHAQLASCVRESCLYKLRFCMANPTLQYAKPRRLSPSSASHKVTAFRASPTRIAPKIVAAVRARLRHSPLLEPI